MYTGHYLPTLAKYIVDKNAEEGITQKKLNLKGFAVGNPLTVSYLHFSAEAHFHCGDDGDDIYVSLSIH